MGNKIWSTAPAQPRATALIPGAVFAGSLDGNLRACDTSDGHLVRDFDTLRNFQTVNGVKAPSMASGPQLPQGRSTQTQAISDSRSWLAMCCWLSPLMVNRTGTYLTKQTTRSTAIESWPAEYD